MQLASITIRNFEEDLERRLRPADGRLMEEAQDHGHRFHGGQNRSGKPRSHAAVEYIGVATSDIPNASQS